MEYLDLDVFDGTLSPQNTDDIVYTEDRDYDINDYYVHIADPAPIVVLFGPMQGTY